MKRCIFIFGMGLALLPAIHSLAVAEVIFTNNYQSVTVYLLGDGEVLLQEEAQDDGGLDVDFDISQDDPNLQANAQGRLKTVYGSESLTVDGHISLQALRPSGSPYTEVAARGHVYFQAGVTVTDAPAWIKITGYLTPDQNHLATNHFLICPAGGYWFADYYTDPKVWMMKTALVDIGDHYLYGGVDYTLTVDTEDLDKIYADYYFTVEVIPAPEFEPFMADLNHSGKVDLADLALFASAWLWEENP